MNFWTVFAGVLSANLLTVMFVWGVHSYSKLEQVGRAHEAKSPLYIGMFMPLLFCLGALLIALDSVPAWLDAMAR